MFLMQRFDTYWVCQGLVNNKIYPKIMSDESSSIEIEFRDHLRVRALSTEVIAPSTADRPPAIKDMPHRKIASSKPTCGHPKRKSEKHRTSPSDAITKHRTAKLRLSSDIGVLGSIGDLTSLYIN